MSPETWLAELRESLPGLEIGQLDEKELLQTRGW